MGIRENRAEVVVPTLEPGGVLYVDTLEEHGRRPENVRRKYHFSGVIFLTYKIIGKSSLNSRAI